MTAQDWRAGLTVLAVLIGTMWLAAILGNAVAPTTPATPRPTGEAGSAWQAPRVVPDRADRHRTVPGVSPARSRLAARTPTTRPFHGEANPAPGAVLSVTAYCPTGHRTASGAWPREGMAAGNRWPFGTRLLVEGVGVVTVTDRIGHGSQLDLFRDTCAEAIRFGRRALHVAVIR